MLLDKEVSFLIFHIPIFESYYSFPEFPCEANDYPGHV